MKTARLSLLLLLGFVLTAQAQWTETNIAYAKRDVDVNYYPDDTVNYYKIAGRVSSPNYSTNSTEFYIQDTTNDLAGILVRKAALLSQMGDVTLGRQVSVLGQIVQTAGVRAIRPDFDADVTVIDTVTNLVPATLSTIAGLLAAAEASEGSLVVITNVSIPFPDDWPGWRFSDNVTVTDVTGSINMRIDSDTNIDGQLIPTNRFDLYGIFTQYDTNAVPNSGYQVLPRFYADLVQNVGQQAPQLLIENSNVFSVAVSNELVIRMLGQDRNAGDTLTITTNQTVTGATITNLGQRESRFNWKPDVSYEGTTNTVIFEVTDGIATGTVAVQIFVLSETLANIVLNEVLWDPHSDNKLGDANNDGVRDANADEFVEIANNNTGAVNVSSWVLSFGSNDLFTFPAGTILTGKTALVVFGGGQPTGPFGHSLVFTSATWTGLANTPAERAVILRTDGGSQIFSYNYGSLGQPDMAATRNPDMTGSYVLHTSSVPWLLFSPGTLNNGAAFPGTGITNNAPLIRPIRNLSLSPGDVIVTNVAGRDPETNGITFAASGQPGSAVFTDNLDGTAVLAYTGLVADAGVFNITIRATDGMATNAETFALTVESGQYDGLIINEFCADPVDSPGVDANGDGTISATQDEFVEIVNTTTAAVDLAGFTIWDNAALKHTFTSVTIPSGGVVVVFGGGSLTNFFACPAQLASSGSFGFGTPADSVILYSPTAAEIDRMDYTTAPNGASWTRGPDITGSWTNHDEYTGYARRASPGTRTDGSAFLTNQPPSLIPIGNRSVSVGGSLSFTVIARDLTDHDLIALSATDIPAGATFPTVTNATTVTNTFTWNPALPSGVYTTTFWAADNDGTNSETITISVTPASALTTNLWNFEDGWQSWTNYSRTSTKDWVRVTAGGAAESTTWKMECNGFLGDTASDDWLISPAIDCASMSDATLKYWIKRSYTGPLLTVKISTNYPGTGDPLAGGVAWDDLTFYDVTTTDVFEQRTNALSAYAGVGTIYMAFRYTSTGTGIGQAARWNVDQVRLIYTTGGDADGDGIDDAWEQKYFGNLTTATTNSNSDADPALDWEEYVADTVPTNTVSYFDNEITNLTGTGVFNIPAGPPTTNSRVYDAWSATSLVNGAWIAEGLDVPGAANGAAVILTVTNDADGRFYRTGVKLP